MKASRVTLLLSVLPAIIALAACSNGNPRARFKTDPYRLNGAGASTMSGEGFSLDCDERNIFPVGQSSIYGENEFTACASVTNPFSVELRGDTTYSSNGQVCVFPVNVQTGNVATLYPAQTGSGQMYLFQCGVVEENSPSTITFQGISFNALLVVGVDRISEMQAYLYAGAVAFAPPYSSGRFR